MMLALQANLHRSRVANDLLRQITREKGADIVVISEQYTDFNYPNWYADELGTAAIWIPEPNRVQIIKSGRDRGFVWVNMKELHIFSCYLTPNETIAEFRDKVDRLEDALLNTTGEIIVAGDFNARAMEWGLPSSNSRGKYILEMASRIGLLVLNIGNTSTFRRPGNLGTIPDITFATERLAAKIQNWRVLEDYTGSDHQYIEFCIGNRTNSNRTTQEPLRRWNLERMDEESFVNILDRGRKQQQDMRTNGRADVESFVNSTMHQIVEACNSSMPIMCPRHNKSPVYWWTSEIAELRRVCSHSRRQMQRAKTREEAYQRSRNYREKRKQLRHAINSSKARCWKKLIDDVETNPWGLGYKLVVKKLGANKPSVAMETATMEKIVRALFPSHPQRSEEASSEIAHVPLFSPEELDVAVRTLKNKKAPGPDGIPGEVLKMVHQRNPDMLLNMYNACLSGGIFCSCWKIARLVLISKGKGDLELPSSYRPLCMLNTAGKVLEKLIKPRLLLAIERAGGLSPKQYGFRSGLSTTDAIMEVVKAVRKAEEHNHFSRRIVLLVTLDVKNAFNTARWSDMIYALEHDFKLPQYLLQIMRDYLKQRVLLYDTTEGRREIQVTAGAAQGSVLGPVLWNAAYDSLLREPMPDESSLVGYADDVAALIAARDVEGAQLKINQVMRTVNRWMADHELSLALNKTEIVVITQRRMERAIPMTIGGYEVTAKHAVRYLGILLDGKLNFWEQIKYTADKAATRVTSLGRLMANTVGPRTSKRRLLMSTVDSILLYGAEIWAEALSKEMFRKRLAQVQRRAAIRVCSAYRTVSAPAVLVIAGTIPIELLAMERQTIYHRKAQGPTYEIKEEERRRTLTKWQEAWVQESRGRWTAKLIPNLKPWFERKHGETNFYLTQLLSGHGYFRAYLYKIGKTDSADCIYCDGGVVDDAQHTFLDCRKWAPLREEVEMVVGTTLSTENVVRVILQGEDTWSVIARYIETILRNKKQDLDSLSRQT